MEQHLLQDFAKGKVLAQLLRKFSRREYLVLYRLIRSGRFRDMGSTVVIDEGIPPGPAVREELRLVSRFPKGLAPALWRSFLAAYGQEAPVVSPL